tara:strand:- start:46407 stop:47888 length:1482 start_codon:yes stop_codon:yes gene_type:complete
MLGTEALYTAEQTRALDQTAIQEFGIAGTTLMSRAAQSAFDCLLDHWPQPASIQVLCGTGNNGGDGFLIADLAHKRGIPVTVWQLGDAARIGGDALRARQQALGNGVVIEAYREACLSADAITVDAMLGTGLGGDVHGAYLEAITAINALDGAVLAVDIPSGLCADTGRILGAAVRADATATFIGLKRGLFTLQAPDCTGTIHFYDLQVPTEVYQQVPVNCSRLELEDLLQRLPARPAYTHKGDCGSVLVIGGDYGMAGAAGMAAQAALRCGAGLVRVATRPEHVGALVTLTPEVMTHGVESGQELVALIEASDVLVLGPGMGQSPWSEQLLQAAAASGKPLVMDADALNMLASARVVPTDRRDTRILTPHPGEAARLLGVSTADVQADRFGAAEALQQRWGGVVILKGNGSLVAGADELLLSDYGNPGMASGGMGDVLSGVIGALVAQQMPLLDAAALAVCLHGMAADVAAQEGERGLIATDLIAPMRTLLG